MRPVVSRLMLAATAATMVVALGGCTRVRGHQGYLADRLLVESVEPGVDTKASVEGTLGRPTFTSQFGPEQWFYIARETKSLAFRTPRAVDQTVLRVSFDPAGNVAKVDHIGMQEVAVISPTKDKTPTLGRKRSLFQEIFGNIGAVGTAATGAPGRGTSGPGGGPNGS